jgi:hypothetical protein
MNHIATGGSSTVSIDEPAHLLLANRRCVICSADETQLKAYDLLPAADDTPFPVKHGRGEGFELRRTAAPPLNIRGYHFVGDINAEGTLGAYAVTRVSTQRQRTSHLYIFNVNTMTHIGTAKRLEYEEVKEQDVQSNNGSLCSEHQLREPVEWVATRWNRARLVKTLLRVCLSPDGQRVVVIMKADIRDLRMRANKRVLIFRRHEDTLRKEFDADVECDLLEGTVHWSSTEGVLRWLQYDCTNKIYLLTNRLQEGRRWNFEYNGSITLEQESRFVKGGKVVPCAGKWYANVQLQKDRNRPPDICPWFQIEIDAEGGIRLLPSKGVINEVELLHLWDFDIRGPVAIWGPHNSLCVIKRLDTGEERRIAIAMGQHLRLGENSMLRQMPPEIFDAFRSNFIVSDDRPRAY